MVVRCLFVEKICLYYFRILLKSSFLIIILEVVFRLGISLLLYFLILVRIIYYVGVIFKSIKKTLPQAVAIGNHDCLTTSYQNHFNVPTST